MKFLIFSALLFMCFISCSTNQEKKEKWQPLFNGENINNWDVKFAGYSAGENYKNTFYVEDGILCVDYSKYDNFNGEFGHLITKNKFTNYKLRVEYRIHGDQVKGAPNWAYRNNGLMLHSQAASSMEIEQSFPVSIECQLYGAVGEDERTNMNVCTPGTIIDIDNHAIESHCFNSNSPVKKGEDWTTVEVVVYSDSLIQHIADGEIILEYTNIRYDEKAPESQKFISASDPNKLSSGHIAIQAEGHPTQFRKIEILELP